MTFESCGPAETAAAAQLAVLGVVVRRPDPHRTVNRGAVERVLCTLRDRLAEMAYGGHGAVSAAGSPTAAAQVEQARRACNADRRRSGH